MIDADQIPILEPTGRPLFSSKIGLFEHVKKHVLGDRAQRWSQWIDSDLIAKARREWSKKLPKRPALAKVARQYYHFAVDSLCRLCGEQKGHRHLYYEPVRVSDDGTIIVAEGLPDGAVQTIQAWELEHKILIIAKSYVRNGKFDPYTICSVYRPFPKLSGNSLRKNLTRKLKERRMLRNTIELVVHDES